MSNMSREYIPEKFPIFMTPPQVVLDRTIRAIESYMGKIVSYMNISKASLYTNAKALNHIAERVEMRSLFSYFS